MLRRARAIGFIALGVLVLAASLVYWRYAEALARPGQVAVPSSLAGERLSQQLTGVEAVDDISRLHAKQFPLVSGAKAVYGGGAATLWVSGAPAAPMAAEMVRVMTAKIAEGQSPFTPLPTRTVRGTSVHELTGMGQRHFYFQAGALVLWLAVDETAAETALQDVLAYYQERQGK